MGRSYKESKHSSPLQIKLNLTQIKDNIFKKIGKAYRSSKRHFTIVENKIKEIPNGDSLLKIYDKLFGVAGQKKKYFCVGCMYYYMLYNHLVENYPNEVQIDNNKEPDELVEDSEKIKEKIQESRETSKENGSGEEIIELSDSSSTNEEIPKLTKDEINAIANSDPKYILLTHDLQRFTDPDAFENIKKIIDKEIIEILESLRNKEKEMENMAITVYKTNYYIIDLVFQKKSFNVVKHYVNIKE